VLLFYGGGEQQRVVAGGSARTKRRAAEMMSDFEFKAKPGAPSPSGRSSSACSHPSWGVVERKAKRGRALAGRLVSQERMELVTVVSGSAGKRRRNDDNGNDRNCKRSAVMRVCTTGEGNGSDLGAGGSDNEASGGEMGEHDGRVAGIGVSAGKEGDMGRSGQIADRRWRETGGIDVV
jgi:hypothetical protein